MMYTVKVKYYDDFDEGSKVNRIFVAGDSYGDVVEKMTKYYSDSAIESLKVTAVGLNDFIIFEDNEKELFNMVVKTVSENMG